MSLERKDVRFKLDPDAHAGLSLIANTDGKDIAEWVETLVVSEVKRRIRDATVIVEEAARLGISGNGQD